MKIEKGSVSARLVFDSPPSVLTRYIDAITMIHLPAGPTAYFKLTSVALTKEIFVSAPTPSYCFIHVLNPAIKLGPRASKPTSPRTRAQWVRDPPRPRRWPHVPDYLPSPTRIRRTPSRHSAQPARLSLLPAPPVSCITSPPCIIG